jgi:class 3 adenylate cyclase
VHTTARVCSAAHGGQIIVSAATRTAVVSSVPIGIRFRSLGRYRLAGLPEAEALFQLQAEGLGVRFPRLRTGRRAVAHGRRGDGAADGQLELPS